MAYVWAVPECIRCFSDLEKDKVNEQLMLPREEAMFSQKNDM